MSTLILLTSLVIDKLFAEPDRFHPLVGFGLWAKWVENRMNNTQAGRIMGTLALMVSIVPFVVLAVVLQELILVNPYLLFIVSSVILYISIGWQSLLAHAEHVKQALMTNNVIKARAALAMIVSRDTSKLLEKDIAKAATESTLENGADSIFSAIFWFMVAGIPGVVLYRLSNTLDAMWGYKNKRYLYFGWAAARLDDILNIIPARLTALSYVIVGNTKLAVRCWRTQASTWKSPNAGPVMAAGAGAINVSLGGDAVYHGELQHRPVLGPEKTESTVACVNSLQHACDLVNRSILLWLLVSLVFDCLLWLFFKSTVLFS